MNPSCTAVQTLDVSHHFSHENLHIRLKKHFKPPQAHTLISLIQHYHQSCKRIFIDVRQVEQPDRIAATVLKTAFLNAAYEPRQIVFKGKSGFALAVNGNRVLLVPEKKRKEHVCRGNCANCRCGHKKNDRTRAHDKLKQAEKRETRASPE